MNSSTQPNLIWPDESWMQVKLDFCRNAELGVFLGIILRFETLQLLRFPMRGTGSTGEPPNTCGSRSGLMILRELARTGELLFFTSRGLRQLASTALDDAPQQPDTTFFTLDGCRAASESGPPAQAA